MIVDFNKLKMTYLFVKISSKLIFLTQFVFDLLARKMASIFFYKGKLIKYI